MKQEYKLINSIKFRILSVIFVLLLTGGGLLSISTYFRLKGDIEHASVNTLETFAEIFNNDLKMVSKNLSLLMQIYLQNPMIIEAFAEQDRAKLTSLTQNFFNTVLKPKYGIKQFQFHFPSGISFLRVHKPAKFGDDLSSFRKTVVAANQTQKPIIGLEVGRAGPGIRVVYPIFRKGKHIGSVEFGGSIKEALVIAKTITGAEYAIGIFSEVFTAAKRFQNTQSDIKKDNLIFYEFSDQTTKKILSDVDLTKKNTLLHNVDKDYFVSSFPIKDYSGTLIGNIFIAKDVTVSMDSAGDKLIIEIAVIFVLSLSIIAVITFIFMQSIFIPLNSFRDRIKDIAEGEGDLTKRLQMKRQDEIGELAEWFNLFLEMVQSIVMSVKGTCTNLASPAEELAVTANEMTRATDEIAEATERESTALSQSSSSIREIAASMQASGELMDGIHELANSSEDAANQATQAVSRANQSIEKIESSSQKIEGIMNVITEIANQTNLLSLNAAIEAAKAGELGKGFAVVAEEVRNLAERSRTSVVEIRGLIDISSENVQEGKQIITDAGNVLQTIIGFVREMAPKINEIAASLKEQDLGIQEISKATEEIASSGEHNATAAHELSESTKQIALTTNSLNNLADQLNEKINKFKTA